MVISQPFIPNKLPMFKNMHTPSINGIQWQEWSTAAALFMNWQRTFIQTEEGMKNSLLPKTHCQCTHPSHYINQYKGSPYSVARTKPQITHLKSTEMDNVKLFVINRVCTVEASSLLKVWACFAVHCQCSIFSRRWPYRTICWEIMHLKRT